MERASEALEVANQEMDRVIQALAQLVLRPSDAAAEQLPQEGDNSVGPDPRRFIRMTDATTAIQRAPRRLLLFENLLLVCLVNKESGRVSCEQRFELARAFVTETHSARYMVLLLLRV